MQQYLSKFIIAMSAPLSLSPISGAVIERDPGPIVNNNAHTQVIEKEDIFSLDSDTDGILDYAEIRIWKTDPFNQDSDGDGMLDLAEIQSGSDPLIAGESEMDKVIFQSKRVAMRDFLLSSLEDSKSEAIEISPANENEKPEPGDNDIVAEEIEADASSEKSKVQNYEVNDQFLFKPISFFVNENFADFNEFEQDDGLFRFKYKNNLKVQKIDEIYYLADLENGNAAFQIFSKNEHIKFAAIDFECVRNSYENKFKNQEVCFTKKPAEDVLANLELFDGQNKLFNQEVDYLSQFNGNIGEFKKSDIANRAEFLKLVLELRYPEKDFNQYKSNCFNDVTRGNPFSGHICYAKSKGIVRGIGNHFYPQSGVNLWGILQILFETFGVRDYVFAEDSLESSLFAQMDKIHASYQIIAKSLYEGLFNNITNETLWSNRVVFTDEMIEIVYNFLKWKNGKNITSYNTAGRDFPITNIFRNTNEEFMDFKYDKDNRFDIEDKVESKFIEIKDGIAIYVKKPGNVFEFIYKLDNLKIDEIKSIQVVFDNEKINGEFLVEYENGDEKLFDARINEDQFETIKENYSKDQYGDIKEKLADHNLLPNDINRPENIDIPIFKIYMEKYDFENIYFNRTSDKRYKAYMEIEYPDGEVYDQAILIKTRGNANRGYIKSLYTIEAFDDFKENENFIGDEFLSDIDEVKLRGFIGEETMLHEKLFYSAAKKVGLIAPDFFDILVEVNGVPMGLYQVTEPISKNFFKRRNIKTDGYYYAQNSGSIYNTNLKFYKDNETTLSQYKLKGKAKYLLDFIHDLDSLDSTLIHSVDVDSIFNFAMLVYITNAKDSLTHNFYVYLNDETQKWGMFPWDADDCFTDMPLMSLNNFKKFASNREGSFNNFFYYLINKLDLEMINVQKDRFLSLWNRNVDLVGQIEYYELNFSKYFKYDNDLWNGKVLERKKPVLNTLSAIKELKEDIEESGLVKLKM